MSEVLALENQLKDAKSAIDRRNVALKLYNNLDFKKLILEDFCVTECARYAQLSADPGMSMENRADALNMAQAAGHLRRFLSVCIQMGNHSERQVPDIEVALEEARQEANE